MLDRDFILNIDQLPVGSLAILAQDPVHPQQTAAHISLCPQIRQEEHPAIAVKLLVDCSGSMGGDSIAAARRALQAIVGQLKSGDRFSLSRFGSSVEHRTRGLWAVKDTTRLSAQRWINDLQADLGGTEMEAALFSTFAIGHDEPSDVLLITDGEIYAIDALLSRAAHAGQRVFVVGIGSSPTEANLRQIAEVTGGACDFVAPGENVEPAILRMFARLRSPRLDAIDMRWPEGCTPIWHSPLPKSVFDADTVHVLAWFDQPPQGMLTLTGKQSRHETSETIAEITLTDSIEDANTVASLVAHARLKTLEGTEATDLAVDYQLISPQTNFLLVHERKEEEKALEMPELHAVKQMHPAGWGGAGSVCASTEPTIKCVRQNIGEIDFGEMTKRPMFARKTTAASVREADGPLEYLDIPAFLRRQADPEPSVGDRVRTYFETRVTGPEVSESLDWDNQAGVLMTPRDFLTYLNNIPQSAWPKTYAELRDLGLPPEVVDWLADIFASEYSTPLEESIVVEVLLSALMSSEVQSRITKTEGPLKRIRRTLQQTFGKTEPFQSTPHVQPMDDLVAYMHDMEPDHWPQAMKAEAPAMSL
jgi:Ca-activated chloride channel family protein